MPRQRTAEPIMAEALVSSRPRDRASWSRMAEEAARDPSRASQIARVLLDHIDTEARTGDYAPEGYLYAGAHTFVARERDLEVEPLQSAAAPTAVPIWWTSREPVPVKIPFDCWIYGVAGWAVTRAEDDTGLLPFVAPTAYDGRDLFTVGWELDGQINFSTDGRGTKMWPASVTVGTRKRPRRLSWTLRRNEVIGVRFRNLWNAIAPTLPAGVDPLVLAEAAIAFYAVKLEMP